jgi:hypothetical protein
VDARISFTFFRSFYDAVKELSDPADRDAVLMAVCGYALDGDIPELTGVPAALFALIRPNLDSSRKKASGGQSGGKANAKQIGSKQEAKREQMRRDRELGIRDREGESTPPLPPKGESKVQWAEHVFMTNAQHDKLLATHGTADTARLIEILDNYKGSTGKKYKDDYRAILSWCVDRLREEHGKKQKAEAKPTQDGNPFLRRVKEMEADE